MGVVDFFEKKTIFAVINQTIIFMKNRILSFFVLTVLFFSIAISCDREVKVKDVSLDRTTILLTVGQSTTLAATVTPEKATNKTVVFTSNNILVATVLPTGLVTGIS